MKQILKEINPSIIVTTIEEEFTFFNAKEIIENEKVDFWIDACDSVQAKIELIESLKLALTPFVICGAAGGKSNPSKICYTDLEKTTNDPLLAKLRYDLRRKKGFPRKGKMKVPCISSSEFNKKKSVGRLSCAGYGSIVTVTASMGLLAASKAIEKITVSKS
jgi:tRNA A37 threonylcarbamoyladenosine dehydratase